MPTQGREVQFSEELKVDLEDSTPDNGDESVETDEQPQETEKDTPAESSPENKPAEEQKEEETQADDSSDESVPEVPQPKPVEGETPRERGLRLDNQKLRAKLRAERANSLLEEEDSPLDIPSVEKSERINKLKEKYSEDDLNNLSEVFIALSEDLGFVRKDHLQKSTYQQQATDILDSFIESHPEYQPENDPDDVLWKQFQDEIKLYRRPQNPKEYKKILERVHQNIFGVQSPEKLNKVTAQKAKIQTASHSATPRSQTEKPKVIEKSSVDRSVARQVLKGFSDEELKEMGY